MAGDDETEARSLAPQPLQDGKVALARHAEPLRDAVGEEGSTSASPPVIAVLPLVSVRQDAGEASNRGRDAGGRREPDHIGRRLRGAVGLALDQGHDEPAGAAS